MEPDTQLLPQRRVRQSTFEDDPRLVNSFEVRALVACLLPQQRLCLGLTWMHYSVQQIAELTGMSLWDVRRYTVTALRAYDRVLGMVSAQTVR